MTFVEQCREVWELWKRKVAICATVGVAALAFYHVVFGANGWVVYQQKKVHYRQLQDDIQNLQTQNDELQKEIKALKTDPKAIEREAREQLHLTRPGEVVYVLPTQKPAQGNPPANAAAQNRKK